MLQILNSLKLFCYRIKVNEYNIDRLKTVFCTSRTYIMKKTKPQQFILISSFTFCIQFVLCIGYQHKMYIIGITLTSTRLV